jgi:hypothetical protein
LPFKLRRAQQLDRDMNLVILLRPDNKGKEERKNESGIANEKIEGWEILIRHILEKSLLNM